MECVSIYHDFWIFRIIPQCMLIYIYICIYIHTVCNNTRVPLKAQMVRDIPRLRWLWSFDVVVEVRAPLLQPPWLLWYEPIYTVVTTCTYFLYSLHMCIYIYNYLYIINYHIHIHIQYIYIYIHIHIHIYIHFIYELWSSRNERSQHCYCLSRNQWIHDHGYGEIHR